MFQDSTNDKEGWADENMNQNENGKECKSSCYKYKTEKGYLCNNLKKGTFSKKKWCEIDKEDVLNNQLTLKKPNKNILGQYWDNIEEEHPQGICYTNLPFNETKYKDCNTQDTRKYMNYMFLIFFIAAITPIVESGTSHILKTHSYTKMSNREFLEDMFREFNKLVNEKYVNKGLLDSESAEKILSDLEDKLLNTDDTDSSKASEFIKDMFKESLELMRVNAAAYGDYSTTVTNFLIEKVPTKHLLEALRGGNFIVEDGGAIYNYTSTNMLSYGGISTHAKNATEIMQMRSTDLFGDAYLHLLSGSFKYKNGEVVSWFQLEGAPMPPGLGQIDVFKKIITGGNIQDFNYYIHHAVDTIYWGYYMAKATLAGGQAINLALGTSLHTDKNPIYVFDDQPVTEELIQEAILDNDFDYKPSDNAFTRNITLASSIIGNDLGNNNLGKGVNLTLPSGQYNTQVKSNFLPSNLTSIGSVPNYAAISMGGKYKKKTVKKKLNKKTKKNKLKLKRSNKNSNKKSNKNSNKKSNKK